MKKYRNTPTKGSVRVIVYKDEKEKCWYGVALEFNLVVSGDTKEEVQYELSEAIAGYIETLRNIKGLKDFSPLNQTPNTLHEKMWNSIEANKKVPSPYKIEFHGVQQIYA